MLFLLFFIVVCSMDDLDLEVAVRALQNHAFLLIYYLNKDYFRSTL